MAAPSSYLQHLPEIFRARSTPGGEAFLARFLKIFEALLSGRADAVPPGQEPVHGLEDALGRLIATLDPAFAPVTTTASGRLDSPFLTYLASWVALTLD